MWAPGSRRHHRELVVRRQRARWPWPASRRVLRRPASARVVGGDPGPLGWGHVGRATSWRIARTLLAALARGCALAAYFARRRADSRACVAGGGSAGGVAEARV